MAKTVVIRETPSNNPADYRFANYASAIENGMVITLGALTSGKRDVYTAAIPTAGDNELWLVTGVPMQYEAGKLDTEYQNESGVPFRAERLKGAGTYAISSDGLTAATPATDFVAGAAVIATAAIKLTLKATAATNDIIVGYVRDVFYRNGIKFASIQFLHDTIKAA